MPHIAANGIQIYYELHGPEEAEVLVLSNGVLMSTASWAMQLPDLAKRFRVLTYDCRGMWQSEHPAGPYSMEQHADDLAALLDALAIPSAHIAGISYGGELSLQFALKYPTRTRSLIVSSSVSEVDAPMRERVQPWVEATQQHDPQRLFEVTAPLNFTPAWAEAHRPLLEAAQKRYAALDFDAFLRLLECFLHLQVTAELAGIQAPTLVLVGEQDILKPRSYAEQIARSIPCAELAVIPNAGHAANWEHPGLWNTLVLGFATKHAA
jgi:3-oxoadipate enol-lactonase